MNNIVISIICLLAQIGFLILVNENELINRRIKKRFSVLTFILMLEVILDCIAISLDGSSKNYIIILKIIKAFEFSVTAIIPVYLCNIIVRKVLWRKIKYIFYVIIGINTILQILSIFNSFMFKVDENIHYIRTAGTWIYVSFLFIEFGLVVFSSFKTYVQNFKRFNSIVFIAIFIIVGFFMRVIRSDFSMDWLMLTISLYMFMLYFSNSFIKIDTMTTLLNQTTYFSRISQLNYSTVIIQIDMNNFKYINDNFGHKKGDEVLKLVGEAIFEVYGDIAYCFRRGGDEFAVIFKPKILEKFSSVENSNIYDEVKKYMNKLDSRIEEISKNNNDILKDGLAQGFGIFYSYSDCFMKGEYKDIKVVIEIADERMFEDKKSKKDRCKKNHPIG